MLKFSTLSAEAVPTATPQNLSLVPVHTAPRWRVVVAELIDRCVPLPFIALLLPQWVVVVVVWHLFCDAAPSRRSLGKWVCRLRVIHPPSAAPCPFWRAVWQRLGVTATQAAWCLWWGIPWVLLYELVALACVFLSPIGRRPDEYLAATQIVTEKIYRQRRKRQST